jgi:NAD-dependent dihydropyrimidine dehydrogenase PreA subunit
VFCPLVLTLLSHTQSHIQNSPIGSLSQYTEDQKKALEECCPTKVFEIDEMSGNVVIANASNCIFCKECIYTLEDFRKAPEDRLAVEIKHSPDHFMFTVETNGSLLAKEVVRMSMRVLDQKLNKLKRAIPLLAGGEY